MNKAIARHFGGKIAEAVPLPGGFSFRTTLLRLADGRQLVFRTAPDARTRGGRELLMADIFAREQFFYDAVNENLGKLCPEVYAIDGSCTLYPQPYQIAEYLPGTPLDRCMGGFDAPGKEAVLRRIGGMAAGIHSIKIDPAHPYVVRRGPWEAFFAGRLRERLTPLIPNGLITAREIGRITDAVAAKQAGETLSFLHLDLRPVNMLWDDGRLFLLDAENCEFGDPLFDLAVTAMAGELEGPFLEGYRQVAGTAPAIGDELFLYYQMERQALVLDLFLNVIRTDEDAIRHHSRNYGYLKNKLL